MRPTSSHGSQRGRMLLVRHRQSTWNAEHRWAGQCDPPLSAQGELDATALGPLLAPLRFDAVVASDLCRASRTAELIAQAMPSLRVHLEPNLREIDIPAWAGRTKIDIGEKYGHEFEQWRSGVRKPPPGSESWEAFEERVLAGLRASAELGTTVLVVAHSGVLRVVRTALGFPEKIKRSRGIWIEGRAGGLSAGPLLRLADASKLIEERSRDVA